MTPQQLQQHIIDNFLPKEIPVMDCGDWEATREWENSHLEKVGRIDGANEMLSQVKSLLPKIIEYILKNGDKSMNDIN